MSLNRYEQALCTYLEAHPDELRHWRMKIQSSVRPAPGAAAGMRELERELWAYFIERCSQVPELQRLQPDGLPRVSLLNLTELLCRRWGPPAKPPRPASS